MMNKNESSGVALQSIAPRTKKIGSRKRKRRKSIPVSRSRYFPKIANCSFRFSTRLVSVPDTKIRSASTTRKKDTRNCKIGADALPKIAPETKIVENEEDQTLVYSLFIETTSNTSVDAVNRATSNYFLRSPSSAHGSVRSLGPLVYTWIGRSNCDDIRSNCLRRVSSSDRNAKPCDACSKILKEDAFRHFRYCPVFRQELDAYNMNAEQHAGYYSAHVGGDHHQTTTCVELVGRWAEERALRHLCTNQCFLRAFAPTREWMMLRKNLKNLTPIGEILNDWTCRLVHDETKTNGDEILETIPALPTPRSDCNEVEKVKVDPKRRYPSSETLLQGHLPRTLFVSVKTGESFPSFQKGRKYILEENDRRTAVNNQVLTDRKSKSLAFDEEYYKATELSVASPLGLLEELFSDEPWRVLICTMLLNKTQRKQNLDCIIFHLFNRWSTADSVVKDAELHEKDVYHFVFALVRPAGLGHSKAKAFVRLSRDYLLLLASKSQVMDKNENSRVCKRVEFDLTRKEVKQLFNCGDYAADAYQIFIRKDFKSPVLSNDYILQAYVEWKRSLSCLA